MSSTEKIIAAQGLKCPLPLLKLKQALRDCNNGDLVRLLSSDSGTQSDVPKWIKMTSHTLVKHIVHEDGSSEFEVRVSHG